MATQSCLELDGGDKVRLRDVCLDGWWRENDIDIDVFYTKEISLHLAEGNKPDMMFIVAVAVILSITSAIIISPKCN